MKLPLNLTKEYIELPNVLEETVNIISNSIGVVEYYQELSKKYKDIVIAEIKEKKEHPNADKLGIYMISIGEKDLIQVVAGDKTLKVGDKVAYINRRASEYPSISEQLDSIYHNGIEAWKADMILPVKNKYPKGSE